MQDLFWQQYLKFGNTREQYFHTWRSFQCDESTDTIDSYIHRVKQVAALLNYGEPQILELFKNTLPSRLYYMLYQIDNLRVAVETAKRLLTKEKIDKQKSGQSSISPFMKASHQNSKKSTKLDRRESQYKPKIFQGRNRGCRQKQDRSYSREHSPYNNNRGRLQW